MGTTYLDRRQLLKGLGVGALAVGAAATLSPVTALADEEERSPLGGWDLNIHEFGGSRRAAANFAEGGAFTTADSLFAGAVGVGAWRPKEDNKFAVKFTVFDFTHGGAKVVVSATGAVTGNSMSGTFSAAVEGTTVVSGTFDGTRMIV